VFDGNAYTNINMSKHNGMNSITTKDDLERWERLKGEGKAIAANTALLCGRQRCITTFTTAHFFPLSTDKSISPFPPNPIPLTHSLPAI
jgi:hypothetical protein